MGAFHFANIAVGTQMFGKVFPYKAWERILGRQVAGQAQVLGNRLFSSGLKASIGAAPLTEAS